LRDLLRERARALAAAEDRRAGEAATGRLLDYYLNTASGQQPIGSANRSPIAVRLPPPGHRNARPASRPGQAAGWPETESASVHAAVGLAVGELPLYATLIPAAISDLLQVRRRWQKAMTAPQTALTAKRQVGDRPGQGSEPAGQHASHDRDFASAKPGGSDPMAAS
jgi:hypothetical protein